MIPLQRISTKAIMPTIMVTSPGFQVSLCPRARIQARMKGAVQASASSQSSVPNVCHALALSPPAIEPEPQFGFVELVVNQGRNSDRKRSSAAPIPMYSPGVSCDVSRYPLSWSALEASIAPEPTRCREDGKAVRSSAPGPSERRRHMAVMKIIELVGSSPDSSDGAVKAALEDARVSLRNIKAVDVVSTGLRGDNLDEWRALVRISFLVERVSE